MRTRLRSVVAPALFSISVILSLMLWWHGGMWTPSGDRLQDELNRPRADFMMFYASAVLLRESPQQLYDLRRQGEAQKAATGLDISSDDVDFLPYPYPSVVALALSPLTILEYRSAYVLMVFVNLSVLGLSLHVLSRELNLDREQNTVLALCATASLSVYATLLQGQVSFFALLFSVLTVSGLRKENDRRAGTWAGLLVFKPTLLPVWIFWFAIRRRWRALTYAAGVSSAMALVSILLVGIRGTMDYWRLSQRAMQGAFSTMLPNNMPTLKAVTYFFQFGDLVWLMLLGTVLLFLWKFTGSSDWGYCAMIAALILVAPHMHPQELVLLLVVVALTLAQSPSPPPVFLRWSLFALMLSQSAVWVLFGGVRGNHWPVMPLIVVGLFTSFVVLADRQRKFRNPDPEEFQLSRYSVNCRRGL